MLYSFWLEHREIQGSLFPHRIMKGKIVFKKMAFGSSGYNVVRVSAGIP